MASVNYVLLLCVHADTLLLGKDFVLREPYGPLILKELCDQSNTCEYHFINTTGMCERNPTSYKNATAEDKLKAASRAHCFAKSRPVKRKADIGSQGSSCRNKHSCRFKGAICHDQMCNCRVGYYFNPWKNKCVLRCDVYDDEMISFAWTSIGGCNTRCIPNVSLADCLQSCKCEMNFVCITAEWNIKTKMCHLSTSGYLDVARISRSRLDVYFYLGQRTRCR